MLEITRYDASRRFRGSLILAVGLGVFGAFVIALFPSIESVGPEVERLVESYPEAIRESFNITAFSTLEGFLSVEFYQFTFLLLFGLYMAYAAGGAIAGDVETGRMDLILAAPVSRVQVILEKFLSLFVPLVTTNLVLPLFVFGSVIAIDESIDLVDLVAVHLLSIPYLLVCAGIGLLLSVLLSRADIAQRAGIAAVFLLFILDSVASSTDYEWLGNVSPTRYYDPSEILVDSTYDVGGALLLIAATLVLVIVSATIFREKDIQ